MVKVSFGQSAEMRSLKVAFKIFMSYMITSEKPWVANVLFGFGMANEKANCSSWFFVRRRQIAEKVSQKVENGRTNDKQNVRQHPGLPKFWTWPTKKLMVQLLLVCLPQSHCFWFFVIKMRNFV